MPAVHPRSSGARRRTASFVAARAAAALLMAAPGAAGAQDTTTAARPPFRRGQWGAEFMGGTTFQAVGLLRFTSDRGAWVLNGSADLSGSSYRGGESSLNGRASDDGAGASARFGRRRYAPLGPSVLRFAGAGVRGLYRYDQRVNESALGRSTDRSTDWSAGAFGEVGAVYLVSPHFSAGLTVSADASYTRRRRVNASGGSRSVTEQRQFALFASPLSLVATVFF